MDQDVIEYTDIFHAILALDVYHRGVNSGLKDLSNPKSLNNTNRVGTATVIRDSQGDNEVGTGPEADIGFVAFQYELDDGTNVYAYRGTDRGFSNTTEIFNGFITGLGVPDATQARAAIDFFNEGQGGKGNADNAIVLGQSLGGGLAGFVGKLYGVEASIFNNMPFELAVQNLHGLITGSRTVEEVVESIISQAYDVIDNSYARQVLYLSLGIFDGAVVEFATREAARLALIERYEQLPLDELREQIYGGKADEDIPLIGELEDQLNVNSFSLKNELLGTLTRRNFETNVQENEIDSLRMLRQDNTPSFFGADGLVGSIGVAIANILNQSEIGVEEGGERHTSSPLIIRMFGELSVEEGGAGIDDVTREFWPSIWAGLYNPDVVDSTGISDVLNDIRNNPSDENGRTADNVNGPLFTLHVLLAYSALNEGGLVFGDTGIRSLYDDAADLGLIFAAAKDATRSEFLDGDLDDLLTNESLFFNTEVKQALADLAVQYAGALALNKVARNDVEASEILGANDATDGVLSLNDDEDILSVDFSTTLWEDVLKIGNPELENSPDPIHRDAILNQYFKQLPEAQEFTFLGFQSSQANTELLDTIAREFYLVDEAESEDEEFKARDIFDRIHIRTLQDTVNVDLTERTYSREPNTVGVDAQVDLYIGSDQNDEVTGTTGDDFIITQDGDDILRTNGGRDFLYGGRGSDMFIDVVEGGLNGGSGETLFENVDDVFYGEPLDKSLLESFLEYFTSPLGLADEDVVDYATFDEFENDDLPIAGFNVTDVKLDEINGEEAIYLTLKSQITGQSETDLLIGIDRVKLTWRRDVVNVTDASLQSPILLDLGGFAPDEVFESDFDEVDYSQLSRGITYVNGTTRFADEGDEGRGELPQSFGGALAEIVSLLPYLFGATPDFLSFGDQRENDALRVTGAENITATDHDDTLWFGQIGFLQSLLSGWPADLGASAFGTIDAGDGNDLIAFTGADVVFEDDLIPEEYGGEVQTPNPETGELEGGSIAAEQFRLTIDGGAGDDRILTRGGTGAITVGGEGRDFIFNTSDFGQIYGDTIDGLDADGNELNHEGLENSDVFWFWPGTFIQDAQPNDILQMFGIPLVGGSNSVAGIPAGDGSLAIDFFNWTTFYGTTTSGQLLVINTIANLLGIGPGGDFPDGVQVVEDYDFGGFSNESYGRAAPGDLGLTFRIFLPRDRADEGVTISLFNAVWGSVFTYIDVISNLVKFIRWRPVDDPLILDLDGDGIETVSESQSGVHFDLDGDFFAESTGWVSSDDGFLALDKNGNGRIDDITELFGAPGVSGFEELAAKRALRGAANDNGWFIHKAA